MSLTDPISYTLELFQCLTGRGWSDNQFLFWKNWKRFVKSFPILYFQYSKNLMLLPTMDGHVFHINSLHDYGLWWSRATEVIEYSCKVSDQWRETKKYALEQFLCRYYQEFHTFMSLSVYVLLGELLYFLGTLCIWWTKKVFEAFESW